MHDGHTHYTPAAAAFPSCAGAIARFYKKTYGLEVNARSGHRLQRRQALAAQHSGGHGRSRRRGHHSHALLGELQRSRADDRRRLCPGADHRGQRFQDDARPTEGRHHAALAAGDAELARQSHRQRLHAAGAGSPRRCRPRAPTSASSATRFTKSSSSARPRRPASPPCGPAWPSAPSPSAASARATP